MGRSAVHHGSGRPEPQHPFSRGEREYVRRTRLFRRNGAGSTPRQHQHVHGSRGSDLRQALGTGNLTASGQTTGLLNYAYTIIATTPTSLNARDYAWGQNYGANATTNPAPDTPCNGSVFDLGGPANKAVVFPAIDHGPLPNEALEYTVYLSNTPSSTNLADWHLATLSEVYLQGWQPDNVALVDGFTTVRTLVSPTDTFRYVSVQGVGSQALRPLFDTEDEIDAVAGRTAKAQGSGSPLYPNRKPTRSSLAGWLFWAWGLVAEKPERSLLSRPGRRRARVALTASRLERRAARLRPCSWRSLPGPRPIAPSRQRPARAAP